MRKGPCLRFSLSFRNPVIIVFFKEFFNVYFISERERETEHKQGRGRERGRHDPKQAPGSGAVSTEHDMGLEPTNCEIMP